MSYADEIKKMTSDPGARRLGIIADDLSAKIAVLQQQVADCCGDGDEVRRRRGQPATDSSTPEPPKPA